MPSHGTSILDFGAFPGSPETSLDVSGQTGFVSSSRLEAWVMPVATADHSADEHMVESLQVAAVYKVDGTLTIKGFAVPFFQHIPVQGEGSQRHRLFGQFTIGWAWA